MSASLPREDAARLMRLATYASVFTAAILIVAKLAAWIMTDAVSLLATLIDSCLDAVASVINLLAVHHALQPADAKHRFGHGKAESLAGLGQAAFITGSAFFLLLEGFQRLLHPQPLEVVAVGIWVMVFSIIATLGLVSLQTHVVKRTGSSAVRADSLHYKTDLFVNASVIAALLLTAYGWPGFDPVFAIAISLYILHSAWEIGHEAAQLLMDHELPDEDRQRIRDIVLQHPEARGIHDLRTRKSGTTVFIQLHLELDDELSLVQAHAISDEVEARIGAAYPNAEIIIHEDPASIMESKAFND